jgi:thioredoxin-dependent peroxiredoxin
MDLKKFEKLNTQVLGVSPDTLKTHQRFTEKYDLHFPLIADEKGTIVRLYAPGRITFIIDKAGIIRYIQKGVPSTRVLLEELEKLRE